MRLRFVAIIGLLCLHAGLALAAERTIGVFVALADNKHQGIVPVSEKLGNGDDPERNLYWGAGEGLKGYFDNSDRWELVAKNESPGKGGMLRTRTYRHATAKITLTARAYRGVAIKQCIQDFESAVRLGSYDLVVYIGHNGLMDFDLPEPTKSPKQRKTPDCIVLCCMSEDYFADRLAAAGGRPVLLTTQLMYPGAFILHAAVESWLHGEKLAAIRVSAAAAYAENQSLSPKAALGVFAKLKE